MTRRLTTLFFMGLLSFLLGCKNNNSNTQTYDSDGVELKDITSRINPAEGWIDIFLKITEETKTDTSHIYIAKGLYKDKIVGLKIEVSSNIGAGIVNGEVNGGNGFVSNAVLLKSIGQESNEFVKALSELYGEPTNKSFSEETISATAFSLNEKDVNLDKKDYYKLKLFFAEDNEVSSTSILFKYSKDFSLLPRCA